MFPPNGSATRRLLPSAGSPRVGFPDLLGSMRRSDSRRTFSPRFVGASRDDTTPCACVRLSVQARRRPGARGFVVWQPPRPLYRDGAAGRPKFLGGPGVPMPCSSTPAKPPPPGRCGGAARPPCLSKPRAFAGSTLGAPEHGLGTGCLRFVGWGAPSRRKTRLPLRARLDGVGLITHRAPTKGFEGVFVTSSPPLPSFPWRKDSLRKDLTLPDLGINRVPEQGS